MNQDTTSTKEKILSILRRRGPSLPVHISSETGVPPLFASAFLSELISDKKVKISHMKVGNSPLYYIEGQEKQLENYSNYLKSKEKEAYEMLKEKKFLKDLKQEPAIRIALRQIRDFAFPFKKEEEIIWRFFGVDESEYNEKKKEQPERERKESVIEKKDEKNKNDLGIFEKEKSKEDKKEPIKEKPSQSKKTPKKKSTSSSSSKKESKFFNDVKEYLSKKNYDISDIHGVAKNELQLIVNGGGEEKLVYAFNKKRLDEKDIEKAFKKASQLEKKYIILSKGEPLKRIVKLMEAIERLDSIESM